MAKPRNVLVIAAHADDEVLGCGATMAKHAAAGDRIDLLLLADGVTSRPKGEIDLAGRNASAEAAARILGVNPPILLGLPDNRLDTVCMLEVVQAVEEVLLKLQPDILYIHHNGDLNVDHRIAHTAALTAARPQPWCSVRKIYAFEVLSSTGWGSGPNDLPFVPTRFVDISAHLEQKREALECYAKEMRDFPHARSYQAVEALARYRGAMMGVQAAEAFMVIRDLA